MKPQSSTGHLPNNLVREEARERASSINGVHYAVELDLTGADDTFDCRTTIQFEATPGSSTFVDYTAPTVREATLNGVALGIENFDGNRIRLSGLAASNKLIVEGQSAYMNTGSGMHRFVDPVDNDTYLHTQFEPFDAHRVFACFDQPDIKATFDFVVTAPDDWKIVSNTGALPEAPAGSSRIWRFPTTKKMSTYITAIIAGPFEAIRDHHRGIDLALWCRKSLLKYLMPDAEELFTVTKQGFDFFEKAFGYPYVFGKYDQLFVPEFNAGAMENAGAITFNETFVFRSQVTDTRRERRASVVLHEMAHMWFGDLVTMRWWDDLWLNESFATYQGTLSLAEATRFSGAWTRFAQGEKAFAYAQDQLPTTHPITADIPDIEATHSNFDGITYSKGASVLRQLVAWVSRDAFDSGIQEYFREHEWANTELNDFLAPLEKASGRDLKAWSAEWLQTAGVNTLSAKFDATDGDAPAFKSFSVVQQATEKWPTLRSHRIGIGLYDDEDGKLIRRKHLELDVVGAITDVIELVGEKVAALVLVNDDDLAYAKTRLDPMSLETVVARVGTVQDGLARALCWASAWEMVRDAELAAREYLQMILRNIESESDIGIVQTLLAQAQGAINVYGDPANRPAAIQALADAAAARLHNADPGSDLQRVWAETFIASATSESHMESLGSLLAGDLKYEGLAVDISLRWSLVAALTASGVDGSELIDSEEKRDPTDEGHRNALACRVSRPVKEAKDFGWQMFTQGESTPVASLRAIGGGFARYDQVELIRPYTEKYFKAVRQIWDSREPEVARAFASGMFPRIVVEPQTVGRVDDFLAAESLPYGLERILLEGKDGVERALRARAKDAESGQ